MVLSTASAFETHVHSVANFSDGDLEGWVEKSFAGKTSYKLVKLGDNRVLRAESKATASGLFRKQRINLNETPILQWRWRAEQLPSGINERTKSGDDYVARVYIVISGGIFFWRTRAINYVWSSHQAVGSYWPNAYTSNASMVAVESGTEYLNQWRYYERNVKQDIQDYFGQDVDFIDAVAIMTDTDNSGQQAVAYYGDIQFVQK